MLDIPTLDVDFVRTQFPAFQEPSLRDKAFFENAGGSYAVRYVQWRLNRFYRERKVQPYAPYAAAQAGGQEMDEARSRLARLMNVRAQEVSFGPSTTQNVYVLANAFREWLKPGDAIIVTDQDHEANTGAWRKLADAGIEVREWQIDPETGHLSLDDLEPLLSRSVRLVCFPHCSNVVGEINDVAAITKRVHDAGAVVCVDGVSYAPHGLPDVGALGADIYLFSTYKVYGPHQGIMVISEDLGTALPNQGHHFNADRLYKRFTPAGEDHAQMAACAGIADYFDMIYEHHNRAGKDAAGRGAFVHDLMTEHETRLLQPVMDHLGAKNSIRVLGPTKAEDRAPTVAIVSDNPGPDLAAALADLGIMCEGGDFYARRPLEAMGVDPDHGVLRLSFVHYTTQDEVNRLLEALDQVL